MQTPSTERNLGWDPSWWPTYSLENWLHVASYLLMAFGLIVLVGAAALMIRHLVRRLRPVHLFVKIGRSMGLTFRECWWLWRLAHAQQLTSPLTLLMSAETLRFHAEAYAGRRQWSWVRLTRRFEAIRQRLFVERPAPTGPARG